MSKPAWKTDPNRVLGAGPPADWGKDVKVTKEIEVVEEEPKGGMATHEEPETDPMKTCCPMHAVAQTRKDRRQADQWCPRARTERRRRAARVRT